MPPLHEKSPMTARELLVAVAGEEHALHTVMVKAKVDNGSLQFICSCGALCSVENTAVNQMALRNVAGEAS